MWLQFLAEVINILNFLLKLVYKKATETTEA